MIRCASLLPLLLLLCLWTAPAHAQDIKYDSFARLPVQHQGRVKPLDSFARQHLSAFAGRDSLPGMNADAWLAETLFDPAQALQRPLFRILHPHLLGLPEREQRRYSYAELLPALQAKQDVIGQLLDKDPKTWTEDQAELMRLQESALIYGQMLRSFSFVLPLNISVPGTLAKDWKIDPEKPFTLQDARKFLPDLEKKIAALVRNRGEYPAAYNDAEKDLAYFGFQIRALEQFGGDNVLLRLIPGAWDEGGAWYSPWALGDSGQSSAKGEAYLSLWRDMAQAYVKGDSAAWDKAVDEALAQAGGFSNQPSLRTEIIYNAAHPFTLSLALYLAAFLFHVLRQAGTRFIPARAALCCLILGAAIHFAGIAARVFILSRPPVGTLYESVIFVACACVIACVFLEIRRRDSLGLIAGALSGILLLFTAQGFAEDDTLKMLVAVLNTNFWLATHVLCITLGYAWCILVSILAHIWLAGHALDKKVENLLLPVKIITIVALLFTALGTMLGGIWADQSWGRFWGWDPKENGALLIVLWILWMLHGQYSGHLNRRRGMMAVAALSPIVAIAWFGVNLLNVGLHSYGFITGVAASLGAFVTAEIFLIGGMGYFAAKKDRVA